MAEFKVNDGLSGEISLFNSSGEKINESVAELDSSSSLKTSLRYAEEDHLIIELFNLYKMLIKKDIDDLNKMVEIAREFDAKSAGKIQ